MIHVIKNTRRRIRVMAKVVKKTLGRVIGDAVIKAAEGAVGRSVAIAFHETKIPDVLRMPEMKDVDKKSDK